MRQNFPGSVRLASAFAALGVVWGAQIGSLLQVGCFAHDGPLWPALLVLVPAALAIVGVVVGQHGHRKLLPFASVAILPLPCAGMTLGTLVGILWWPPEGIVLGAHDGLLFGLAALPLLLPVFVAARSVGRARPRSVVDRVDGYSVWGAVGLSCALSSAATVPHWNGYPACGVAQSGSQLAGLVGLACALLGSTLTAAMWAAQRAAGARLLRLHSESLSGGPPLPALVDLGLGDLHWERETAVPTAYRSVHRADLVVRGDPNISSAAIAQSAVWTGRLVIASVLASLVCLVHAVL